MQVQNDPIKPRWFLAHHGTKDIAIIENDGRLIAICAACEAYIHWDWVTEGNGWICSDPGHGINFDMENAETLENSLCDITEPTDDIRTWAARWLEVPEERVDIARG